MEVVALASTFATLTGVSMQLCSAFRFWITAAKNECPSDLRIIVEEAEIIASIADTIKQSLMDEHQQALLDQRMLDAARKCTDCMERLLQVVPPHMLSPSSQGPSAKDKVKLAATAAAWAFSKKDRCKILRQELSSHKNNLTLGLTTKLHGDVRKVQAMIAGECLTDPFQLSM
jgi:hypothetical protein